MSDERVHIFVRTPHLTWKKVTEADSMEDAQTYWKNNLKGRGVAAWTEFVYESKVEEFLGNGESENANKKLAGELTVSRVLHIIRNPYGWHQDDIRRSQLAAADEIERLQNIIAEGKEPC